MADYYTHASAGLPLTTPEQQEWIKKYLPLLHSHEEGKTPLLADLKHEAESLDKLATWTHIAEYVGEETYGLDASIETPNDPDDLPFLWIRCDDGGSIDLTVYLIHIFLARFKEPPFHMQWAETCSRLRKDAFAGGACVVTDKEIFWMHTSSWIDDTLKTLEHPPAEGNPG